MSIATYKWTEYAKNDLKWDRSTIYAIAFTPAPVVRENGELIIKVKTESLPHPSLQRPSLLKTKTEENPKPDCSCATNDDCTRYSKCKKTDGCRVVPKNCGVMNTESCTGFCYTLE